MPHRCYQYPYFLNQDDEFIEFNSYLLEPDIESRVFNMDNPGTAPESSGENITSEQSIPGRVPVDILNSIHSKIQGQLYFNNRFNTYYSIYDTDHFPTTIVLTRHEWDQLHLHLSRLNLGYDLRYVPGSFSYKFKMFRSIDSYNPIRASLMLLRHIDD